MTICCAILLSILGRHGVKSRAFPTSGGPCVGLTHISPIHRLRWSIYIWYRLSPAYTQHCCMRYSAVKFVLTTFLQCTSLARLSVACSPFNATRWESMESEWASRLIVAVQYRTGQDSGGQSCFKLPRLPDPGPLMPTCSKGVKMSPSCIDIRIYCPPPHPPMWSTLADECTQLRFEVSYITSTWVRWIY